MRYRGKKAGSGKKKRKKGSGEKKSRFGKKGTPMSPLPLISTFYLKVVFNSNKIDEIFVLISIV